MENIEKSCNLSNRQDKLEKLLVSNCISFFVEWQEKRFLGTLFQNGRRRGVYHTYQQSGYHPCQKSGGGDRIRADRIGMKDGLLQTDRICYNNPKSILGVFINIFGIRTF